MLSDTKRETLSRMFVNQFMKGCFLEFGGYNEEKVLPLTVSLSTRGIPGICSQQESSFILSTLCLLYSLTGWLLSVCTISGQVFPVLLEWVPVGTWCGFLTWKVFYCLTDIVFLCEFHTFRLIWITLLLSMHAEKHSRCSFMSICSNCAARLSYPPLSPLSPSTDSLPCFCPLWLPIFIPAPCPQLCPGKAVCFAWPYIWVDGRAYS